MSRCETLVGDFSINVKITCVHSSTNSPRLEANSKKKITVSYNFKVCSNVKKYKRKLLDLNWHFSSFQRSLKCSLKLPFLTMDIIFHTKTNMQTGYLNHVLEMHYKWDKALSIIICPWGSVIHVDLRINTKFITSFNELLFVLLQGIWFPQLQSKSDNGVLRD